MSSCGPKKRELSPQSVWDEAALRARCDALGVKPSHVGRLYQGLVRGKAPGEIHELPKKLLALLDSGEFVLETSRLVETSTSADGSATKVRMRPSPPPPPLFRSHASVFDVLGRHLRLDFSGELFVHLIVL